MTTISDVAKLARVSPATVSRVLNGTSEVSSARADRVRKAVAELNYVPFSPARALRRQLTDVWAVIVADIENPFFTSVVRGIEDGARERNCRVVLCNADEDPAKEAEYIDVAIAERMGGVIIAVSGDGSNIEPLVARGVPVVAIDRRPADERVDIVLSNNKGGSFAATQHLIEQGAKRIACITGPRRISTANERLAGYRQALTKAKRAYDASLVIREDFRPAGGARAVRQLFSGRKRPDGLFIANNQMTVGALGELASMGIDIPGDVKVVGYDDAPWATLIRPALSVVAQPTYDIGRTAADLLATARERKDRAPTEVLLDPKLVVRESSTAAKKK